jgi:hypothetical protein
MKAFLEESPRPTYEDLAIRFHCTSRSIEIMASKDGWPDKRLAYQQTQMVKADAALAIAKAAGREGPLVDEMASTVNEVLMAVRETLRALKEEDRPARHRMDVINTASFAAMNCAQALQRAGIVGMHIGIKDAAGAEGYNRNGQWDPKLLQQINITLKEAGVREVKVVNGDDAMGGVAVPVTPAPDGTPPTAAPNGGAAP